MDKYNTLQIRHERLFDDEYWYKADEVADLAKRGLDWHFKQGLHKEGCSMPIKCDCGLHAYWNELEALKEGKDG